MGLLESVPLDFVKIDEGTIIQGLASDPQLQIQVRALVEAARRRNIQTIGERVEDANTMAVLWQLGVQYIRGATSSTNPEEVVLRRRRAPAIALAALRRRPSLIKTRNFVGTPLNGRTASEAHAESQIETVEPRVHPRTPGESRPSALRCGPR